MTEGIAVAERAGTSGELAWRLAPVAVALGSLALGVVALGHRALTVDEAASAAAAQDSLGTVVSRIVHDDPGQAGELLLLKVAGTVGDSELALRLPSAIAVALAAGLLVVLGTLLLERVGGLVAGLAFAVNAGVIEASREARPYAVGLLGIVLATLLFVFALERDGGWRWIPYAAVAALLPLTHPLAASVLAAHGATLIALRERPDLRRAGIALVAGTVVAGALLAWMAADRFDAPDGAGTLDLARLGRGLARSDWCESRPSGCCSGGPLCAVRAARCPARSLAGRARGGPHRRAARRPAARALWRCPCSPARSSSARRASPSPRAPRRRSSHRRGASSGRVSRCCWSRRL